jgi:hypothetical protein
VTSRKVRSQFITINEIGILVNGGKNCALKQRIRPQFVAGSESPEEDLSIEAFSDFRKRTLFVLQELDLTREFRKMRDDLILYQQTFVRV